MSETTLIDVTLHDVGEGLAEAEIVEWLFAPGDAVKEDQPIILISTDKATVELPAPASGILREQVVAVGTHVQVGALLARIEVSTQDASKITPGVGHAPPITVPSPKSSATVPASAPAAGPVAAAPSTRKLAQQLNVDLKTISGTGPHGRIVDDDVRRVAAAQNSSASDNHIADAVDEMREPMSRGRLATARAISAAWRDVPHIVDFRQIDATALQNAREAHRAHAEREGIRLTFMPFFVKAIAIALAKHPNFNARVDMDRGEIASRRACHIGIATAGDAGLIVPGLRNADGMSIIHIARALDTLVDRAKRQLLSPEEMAPGSFTITNYGSYGTTVGIPIIRSPESGIAGFGRIQPGVMAVDGIPVVRPILPFCVAADHRLNDGIHLAEFIDTITAVLSNPTSFDITPE